MSTIPSFNVMFSQIVMDSAKSGAETMDAYTVGGGLALLAEGWRSTDKQGNGWTELVNGDQPRRAVHTDGRVRVWRNNAWTSSLAQRNVDASSQMTPFMYHGTRHTWEVSIPAFHRDEYASIIKGARESRYEHKSGETRLFCQFVVDVLPESVSSLLHDVRPGIWQAALLIVGQTAFWFADDVAAKQDMARGFYAYYGEDVPEAELALLTPPVVEEAPIVEPVVAEVSSALIATYEEKEVGKPGWWWISGDTKPNKEALKASGLRWSRKRSQWYFMGADLPQSVRELVGEGVQLPAMSQELQDMILARLAADDAQEAAEREAVGAAPLAYLVTPAETKAAQTISEIKALADDTRTLGDELLADAMEQALAELGENADTETILGLMESLLAA